MILLLELSLNSTHPVVSDCGRTTLENDRFRFDSVPGIEMKPIFPRFSRAHFPIEMNKHKIGKITTQKFGLDISTLMYAS